MESTHHSNRDANNDYQKAQKYGHEINDSDYGVHGFISEGFEAATTAFLTQRKNHRSFALIAACLAANHSD